MHRLRQVSFFFILVCLTLIAACDFEIPTSVTIAAGPTFKFSGSGRLAIFTIYGPRSRERIAYPWTGVSPILWQIKASRGYFDGAYVNSFRLAYGKVPEGYEQTVPSQSQSAPQLSPGLVYSFFAETSGAPVSDGFFYMNGAEPIQTEIPDLCLMLVDGHETRVSCKDHKPYNEPTDLQRVVLENRVSK